MFLLLLYREELGTSRDRLLNGLSKLNETNQLVDKMKTELAALQPELVAKAAATAELLQRVAVDQEQAEQVKVVVAAEEADVKIMQQETQVRQVENMECFSVNFNHPFNAVILLSLGCDKPLIDALAWAASHSLHSASMCRGHVGNMDNFCSAIP